MPNKKVEVNTNRLILKSIDEKDYDRFSILLTNEEIKQTYMIPDFKSKDELLNVTKRIANITNDLTRFTYGIYLDELLIGYINETEKDDETIELGYFIDPTYKGKGYASEALKAAVSELFNMGFKTIKAEAFIDNIASQKVMMKAGMKKTEEAIDDEEYHGVYHKVARYQIGRS